MPATAEAAAGRWRHQIGAGGIVRVSDPLLLRGFCELTQERAVPLMLLRCYPYLRQAGYLAHA
jgi:hypothetical protein